jgi:phage tail-like protein
MPGGLPGLTSDALAGYHFSVEVDGVTLAQFQEVSGITSELDVIELKENTRDGKFILHKLPGNRKPPTITLKRAKNASTDLWEWHKKMYQGNIVDARKHGSIVMYDYTNTEVSRYNFINAWPSKVTTSALKAGANEIVTEEVTIVCEELERVK